MTTAPQTPAQGSPLARQAAAVPPTAATGRDNAAGPGVTATSPPTVMPGTTTADPDDSDHPTARISDHVLPVPAGGNADPTSAEPGKTTRAGRTPRRRRPRDIGTAVESAVVRYLQANGFPHAERRSLKGAQDCGDVTGCPGLCIEVKGGKAAENASCGQIDLWLDETETERFNARSDIGILVVKRKGISGANAGQWWAILPLRRLPFMQPDMFSVRRNDHLRTIPVRLHLADAVTLLRAAGYGEAP